MKIYTIFFSELYLLFTKRSQCADASTVGHLLPSRGLGHQPTNTVTVNVNSTGVEVEERTLRYYETFHILHKVSAVTRKKNLILLPSETPSLC